LVDLGTVAGKDEGLRRHWSWADLGIVGWKHEGGIELSYLPCANF